MRKAIGRSSFILLLFLSFACLFSCQKQRKFDIEENNELFFNKYVAHYERGISLDSLAIYYYESYFYYDVEGQKEEADYHFLYIFRYQQFQTWYSIKNPEEDKDYTPNSYYKFLHAKESGKSKIYTQDEISNFIYTYYNK